LEHYNSYYLVRSTSILVGILAWAILAFLDRSTDRYRTFWYFSLGSTVWISILLWQSIDGIYLEIGKEPESIGQLGPLFLSTYWGASFFVLIVLGWLPPKSFNWQLRCFTGLATTAMSVSLWMLFEKNVQSRFEQRSHASHAVGEVYVATLECRLELPSREQIQSAANSGVQ